MKNGITLRVIGPVVAISLLLLGLAAAASVYLSQLQEKTARLLSESIAGMRPAEERAIDPRKLRAAEELESDLRELHALTRWLTHAILLLGGAGAVGGLTAGFVLLAVWILDKFSVVNTEALVASIRNNFA